METMARFHQAARGFTPMPGSEFKVSWGKWPDRCFAEVNELVKQKLELKDSRSSSFDDKFWEQVDRLIERGLMAWQRFNHENYRKVLKEEMEAKAFNLHSFKAESLLLVDGEVVIKSMERARFELQVYDLAFFFDVILQNSEIPVSEVAGYLRHYTKIRPLNREEREALLAFLFYPKGLYRLIRHYYRNRRVKDGLIRFGEFVKLMDKEEELIHRLMQELEE
jgi:CotS family spore coat protein